jgi:hypothetical protein
VERRRKAEVAGAPAMLRLARRQLLTLLTPMYYTLRAMAKTYLRYVPEQDLLLLPSLRDWLPEDHHLA